MEREVLNLPPLTEFVEMGLNKADLLQLLTNRVNRGYTPTSAELEAIHSTPENGKPCGVGSADSGAGTDGAEAITTEQLNRIAQRDGTAWTKPQTAGHIAQETELTAEQVTAISARQGVANGRQPF